MLDGAIQLDGGSPSSCGVGTRHRNYSEYAEVHGSESSPSRHSGVDHIVRLRLPRRNRPVR